MPAMHEVDYTIFGNEMQYVEVELDPNEAAVAEAGGMMYMEDGIEMGPFSVTDPSSSVAFSTRLSERASASLRVNPYS